jgi:phage gp46-like protein
MADIRVIFDQTTCSFSWGVVNNDLDITHDLDTAISISLFSDRVAGPDYVAPPGTTGVVDKRGHFSDSYEVIKIGSRLWQLKRAKKIGNTLLQEVKDMSQEALQWLLDYNIASTLLIQTSWQSPRIIAIAVTVTEPVNGITSKFTYAWAWQTLTTATTTNNRNQSFDTNSQFDVSAFD